MWSESFTGDLESGFDRPVWLPEFQYCEEETL